MEDEICLGLGKLKIIYEELRKKYNLPSFKELNEDFEIEKLQDKETDTLSREVRRALIDRNVAYLRFIEMFLNPNSAPMFFLILIKNVDNIDMNEINSLYLELGRMEIESMTLDNEYSEKNDAEFIKKFYKDWKEIKKKFSKIMKSLEKAWQKKAEKKDKGYLG